MTRPRKALVAVSVVIAGLLCAVVHSRLAHAGQYEVSATRKGTNLYKIDGTAMYVETRSCYEFVYSAPAVLDVLGSRGSLTFKSYSGASKSCTVAGIYETQAFSGKVLDSVGNLIDVSSLLVPVRLN